MQNFFYSLISFITAIFFIMLGVLCVLLPWFPGMRTDLIQFLSENAVALVLFGLGFIAVGIATVVNVIMTSRRNYFQFKIGVHPVNVDEELVEQYLLSYWKEVFPEDDIPSRLVIKNNQLYVSADLPYVPQPQQNDVLDRIKTDLRDIFGRYLGYDQQFYLSASFQPEKKQDS
jgi:hypothetical protein